MVKIIVINRGFAGQVGDAGFGIVFALLIILAIVIWLTGRPVNRTGSTRKKSDGTQKGGG